jgi:branched-chain amino acid transport system substrate-binding protein
MQHDDAFMNANNHQLQQSIYLATANLDSTNPDELFKIVSRTSPDEVADKDSEAKCHLESYEATVAYEP